VQAFFRPAHWLAASVAKPMPASERMTTNESQCARPFLMPLASCLAAKAESASGGCLTNFHLPKSCNLPTRSSTSTNVASEETSCSTCSYRSFAENTANCRATRKIGAGSQPRQRPAGRRSLQRLHTTPRSSANDVLHYRIARRNRSDGSAFTAVGRAIDLFKRMTRSCNSCSEGRNLVQGMGCV
jgi:hypothetical protein